MPVTSTNYTSLSYIEEVTPGVFPASTTVTMDEIPTTGGAPAGNLTTAVSEAIRRDRMTDDLIVVDSEVGGDINYELSYLPYKPLLKSLLQDDTAPNVVNTSETDLTFSAAGKTITSAALATFVTDGIVVGMNIRVASTTSNNGVFKVTNVTELVITVAETIVDEGPAASATITADMVRNGVAAPQTYSILKLVEGITDTAYFFYTGCIVSAMSFNFTTGSILNGTISVVGRTETVTEASTLQADMGVTTLNTLAPAAYTIMNSVQSLGNISITGLAADTCFSTLNLTVNNNVNQAKCIGTLGAHDLASFTLDITADIELYFEDVVTYNLYKNSSSFSLSFRLTDGDGNVMVVTLPACKFETLDSPIDGKDNFYMLTGSMRALRDTTTDCMIQFDFLDV